MGDIHLQTRQVLAALALLCSCLGGASAHGYVVSPPSRNMLALGRYNYGSSAGNGLGPAPFQPVGNPGVCGDPFQEASTNFAGAAPGVQASYSQGQTIDITVDVNVNHGGRFSFSVCSRNTGLDQACFDQHQLERSDGNGLYYYLLTGSFSAMSVTNPQTVTTSYKLPAGLTCPGGCVLQWTYRTYNSCVDSCPASICGFYADRRNDITGQSGPLGFCGAITPEIFQNCSDIKIESSGGSPSPPSTSSGGSVRCGAGWADANSKCGTACPSGTNSECPSGETCFASLSTSPCQGADPPVAPAPPPTTSGSSTVRCGAGWGDANSKCGTACPSATNAECPGGQTCFAHLSTSPCQGAVPTVRCGAGWGDANSKCGTACPSGTNAECPGGQTCFADLSTSPCA